MGRLPGRRIALSLVISEKNIGAIIIALLEAVAKRWR